LQLSVFVSSVCIDGACNATVLKTPVARETLLMQVGLQSRALQQRAAVAHERSNRTQLTDAVVATHIKSYSRDATNVAGVIQKGLQAIISSTMHFSVQPPRVAEGITALGEELFECVSLLLSDDHKATDEFQHFKNAWDAGFLSIPGNSESIETDIDRYTRDGNAPALIRAVGSIINEAGIIVSNFMMPETGSEVVKYLSAVNQAFVTLGESWDAFAEGKTVDGIESIYWGLRSITDGLMPDILKDNEIYNTIIGTLDFVIGNLSTHVLEYERRIMESNVCWRTERNRESQRPMLCPENYAWDGAGYCYPTLALAQTGSRSQTAVIEMDKTVEKKGGDNSGGGHAPAHNAIPARCDLDGYFSQKHGMYCYNSCGEGFQQKDGHVTKCISACEGNFSAETPMMCGRDSGIITKAILEMVTVVLNSAFSLADNIMTMQEHGVDADTLTSTIEVFIDLGKPFANPTCPAPAPPPVPEDAHSSVVPSSSGSKREVEKVQCTPGSVYVTSHRGAFLQDNNGWIGMSSNKGGWEKWELSDAGDGNVFVTSHRGRSLSDHNGQLELARNKNEWEKWSLFDAGDGNVFLRSHRMQVLGDNNGDIYLSWNTLDWEKWSVETTQGSAACSVAEKPENTTQLLQQRATARPNQH